MKWGRGRCWEEALDVPVVPGSHPLKVQSRDALAHRRQGLTTSGCKSDLTAGAGLLLNFVVLCRLAIHMQYARRA